MKQVIHCDNPLSIWMDRRAALRLREAMIRTNGNVAKAAELIGCTRFTAYRILARDNKRIAPPTEWKPEIG